jgi:peptidoglycan/LPS O-acetylase OafA/YrhL
MVIQDSRVALPPGVESLSALARDEPRDAAPSAGRHSRLPSLDGLRALSIAAVLIGHVAGTDGCPAWLTAIGRNPYIDISDLGVRVFFVISGFLITGLLMAEEARTGSISLGRFYLRRALRIFPAYFAFLAVLAGLAWARVLPVPPSDFLYAATFTTNYIAERSWYVGHLWSLAVEEQFYLLWPAAIALSTTLRAWRIALAVVCLLPLVRLVEADHVAGVNELMGTTFETAADALAIGCLLALARDRLWSHATYRDAVRSRWFAPLLLLLGVLVSQRYRPGLLLGDSLINAGIVLGVDRCMRLTTGAMGRLLNTAPLIYVGTLSYSLYLWQQIFLDAKSHAVLNAFPVNLVAAAAAALLSFYLVERPVLRVRPRVERWVAKLRSSRRAGAARP